MVDQTSVVSTFEGVLDTIKDVVTSGPARGLAWTAQKVTAAGMYLGMTSPETANIADIISATQDYMGNKMTGEQLATRGVRDFVDWVTVSGLEGAGVPAPIAAGLGRLAEALSDAIAPKLIGMGEDAFASLKANLKNNGVSGVEGSHGPARTNGGGMLEALETKLGLSNTALSHS